MYIEEAKPFKFSCDSPTPSLWLNKELSIGDVICLVCGDKLSKNEIKKGPIECVECHRKAHKRCLRKLKVVSNQFKCDSVKQRIVPIKLGSMKLRQFDSIKPRVATGAMRCLICGELHTEMNRVGCGRSDCDFSCHSECLQSYKKIILSYDGIEFDIENWCCDDIRYWVDHQTVANILELPSLSKEIIQCFIDNCNIESVKLHPDVRKRRYENDPNDQICPYCNNVVPLEQHDHIWSYCPAIPGSPPSKDPMEAMPKIKQRCLEITKAHRRSQNKEAVGRQNQQEEMPLQIRNSQHDDNMLTRSYADVASTRLAPSIQSNIHGNTQRVTETSVDDRHARYTSELYEPTRNSESLRESSQSNADEWSPTKSPARKRVTLPSLQIECSNRFAVLELSETSINSTVTSPQRDNQEQTPRRHKQNGNAEGRARNEASNSLELTKERGLTLPNHNSASFSANSRRYSRLRPRRERTQSEVNDEECIAFRTRSRKTISRSIEGVGLSTEGNTPHQSNNVETLQHSRGQNYRMTTPGVDFSSRSSEVCSGAPRPPRHRGSLRDCQQGQ